MKDTRMTSKEAGYMELENAFKNADCYKVNVPGGISLQLACCNEFKKESRHTQSFKCGTCTFKKL